MRRQPRLFEVLARYIPARDLALFADSSDELTRYDSSSGRHIEHLHTGKRVGRVDDHGYGLFVIQSRAPIKIARDLFIKLAEPCRDQRRFPWSGSDFRRPDAFRLFRIRFCGIFTSLHGESTLTFELQRQGERPQYFPFSISHLPFAITGTALLQWQMANVKWKMENATASTYKASGGMESFHVRVQARTTTPHSARCPCRTRRAGRCRIGANPDTNQKPLQASRAPGSDSKAILMMRPFLRHR